MRTRSSSTILINDGRRKSNRIRNRAPLEPSVACKGRARQRKIPIHDNKEVHPTRMRKAIVDQTRRRSTKKRKVDKTRSGKPVNCLCVICSEEKHRNNMFTGNKCHEYSFCKDCISKYVTTKVQENIVEVKCPDLECDVIIEPESCRSLVPVDVLDRWETELCISLIPESERFYCPYDDCSGMLIKDGCRRGMRTECPHCCKKLCAKCKVPWHKTLTCKEFQSDMKKLKDQQSDEDIAKFAESMNWKKCPFCGFYVERISGCNHMECRCGNSFCYGCGWKKNNGRCECSYS